MRPAFSDSRTAYERVSFSSWPGLSRPSTPFFFIANKTWMPGTRPGMTSFGREPYFMNSILSQALSTLSRGFGKMRPDDFHHAVGRGARREEAEIIAGAVHQIDEGGVVDGVVVG
jgi:hypothetical protein